MADEKTLARDHLDSMKSDFGILERNLKKLGQGVSGSLKDEVAAAEAALKDLKVRINAKLGAVPFIAGASVKSGTNQID